MHFLTVMNFVFVWSYPLQKNLITIGYQTDTRDREFPSRLHTIVASTIQVFKLKFTIHHPSHPP